MKPQTLLLFAVAILLLLASLASCDSREQFKEPELSVDTTGRMIIVPDSSITHCELRIIPDDTVYITKVVYRDTCRSRSVEVNSVNQTGGITANQVNN